MHSWRDDLDFHKPKIDTIILTCITDPTTVVTALTKGDINFINRYYSPTLESLIELKGNPEITIKSRPSSRTYFISTAYWKEPFSGSDGIHLRKAINYALDREEIVTGAFFGYATPATDTMLLSPLLPDAPECCYKGYDYNISKAKQILSDAGWKDMNGDSILEKNGKSLRDLDLVITSDSGTNAGLTWMKDVALIVQSQLKNVGINVKIRTLESSAFAEATKNGDFDLRLQYTQYQPTTFQLKIFNSSLILYGNSSYANENNTLENIAYKAGIGISEKVRDQNICQACNILYEDAGTIPLVHPMEYTVMSSKVKGYEFGNGNGYLEHAEECWIDA
ncbi:MAG: Bacterial extracellular solute-binding proteins, family 5 Middle [Methanosaeta sp. PtaU1.Bin112]|nr:MAG: Bacterial extracellular solute-binding proteins, family 5 Middle [Methanosaeta sp. PtaU1.Bin112]